MPIYVVTPHQGVGSIRFGMHRAEVQATMRLPVQTFQKAGVQILVDSYHDSCFQIFYDAADTVEYIELSRDSSVTALYRDLDVFVTPAEQVVQYILQHAPLEANDPELGYTYIFPDLDLSVWRPNLPEEQTDGGYFSTIGIGKRGYYSS